MELLLLALLGMGAASLYFGGEPADEPAPEGVDETGTPTGDLLHPDGSDAAETPPGDLLLDTDETPPGTDGEEIQVARHGATALGGDGEDRMHGAFGGRVYGGGGDDLLSLDHRGAGFGGAGDDIFAVSGGSSADGGDGDDLFLLDLTDEDGDVLTGGDGADTFVMAPELETDRAALSDTIITDFEVGRDLLVLSGDTETSGLLGFNIRSTDDGLSTEVILNLGADTETGVIESRTIRLEGVAEFDEADVRITPEAIEPPGPNDVIDMPVFDTSSATTVQGSDDDSIILPAGDAITILDSGDGDDSVQSEGGNVRGTLGLGDDLFVANGGTSVIDGGAGDDSLLAAEGTSSRLLGGEGDDSLTALADDQSDRLIGGAGQDSLAGGLGDHLDAGAGADTVVLTVLSEHMGLAPAQISGLGFNHTAHGDTPGSVSNDRLVLNLPEDFRDDLRFTDITSGSGHSTVVTGTEVFLGDTMIARIDEYDGDGIGWRIDDPRLTVNWI